MTLIHNQPQSKTDIPSWASTASFLVGSVGFPIVVAGYLLYKITPILDQQLRLLERILWMLERGGGLL